MVNFGFRELGPGPHLILVHCRQHRLGPGAGAAGFPTGGTLAAERILQGRWWDTLLFALLREEWEELAQYRDV